MQTEEEALQKRFRELAERAGREGHYLYTGFLNLAEQSLLKKTADRSFPVPVCFWGGYEGAERQMAALGSPDFFGYEPEFPIACLEMAPLQAKFADSLSHRDFLGALLHLGVERSVLGDILIRENRGYLFCLDSMADYLSENLERVRHTAVRCRQAEEIPSATDKALKEINLVIASLRLDALVAGAFHLSRSQSTALFNQERIFVNGVSVTSPSAAFREGDLISVRGKGRFYYDGELRETKKGRKGVKIRLFD